MSSTKMLISMPGRLKGRMDAAIPARQRSVVICGLIEAEVKRREQGLYECAQSVENDELLNHEMADWNVTLNDGDTNNESW